MRREDAAKLLGTSTKTVYRLERAGRIPSRKVKTSSGQVVVYDAIEIEQVKRELDSRPANQSQEESGLRRVSFSLSPDEFGELRDEAIKYGLKPGEYARQLMREAVESRINEDIQDLRLKGARTLDEVRRMRDEIAAAFEALLEYLDFAPEEARTWVTRNIR